MSEVVIYLEGKTALSSICKIESELRKGNAVVLRGGFPKRKYHPGRSRKVARLSVGESFEVPFTDKVDWENWRTLVSTVNKDCGVKCSVNKIYDKLKITRLK